MSVPTMKAARWYAAKDIRVEDADIPSAGSKQVKIEVQYAGICGSDLHEYAHGPMLIPSDKPYPLNGHIGVTTLGHEFSGIVAEVGADVKHIKAGDRVVVEPQTVEIIVVSQLRNDVTQSVMTSMAAAQLELGNARWEFFHHV